MCVRDDGLTQACAQVAAVSNAEDVMAEVAKGGAAAVFIPTQMPGQSGWELLEKLRQDDRLEHLPIVAICATGINL